KAASGQPVSISTEDAAAISTSATQSLILDGTGAAISVKSVKGAADTKLSEAIKALGKVTVKGNVVVANENPDTDAVDVTADGVEIAAGANLTADVASTKDVSITGTITGNVNAAANAVSVSLSSSSTGTVTGNVDGAAITVDGLVSGIITASGTVAVSGTAASDIVATGQAVSVTGSAASISDADTVTVTAGSVAGDIAATGAVVVVGSTPNKPASVGSISGATTVEVGVSKGASVETSGVATIGSIEGATGAITLNDTANVSSVSVENKLVLVGSPVVSGIVLGASGIVDNTAGKNDTAITLADGSKATVKAGEKYSSANFTIELDEKLDLTYTAEDLASTVEGKLDVLKTGSNPVKDTDYTVAYENGEGE
ncbi:MAG: hypothetical protein RR505_04790, partial [Raoultibacter sp.]